MVDFRYRLGGPGDDDRVAALAAAAGLAVDPKRERSVKHSRLWVAETSGPQVVAFALAWLVVGELEILDVAVDRALRRRGLARTLLQWLCEAAREEGADRVILELRRSNVAARQLYEGLGLKEEGLRKGYYADGEDALLLGGCLPLSVRSTLSP